MYPSGRIGIKRFGLKKNFIQTNFLITLGILLMVVLSFGYLWIKDNLKNYDREIRYIEQLYIDAKKAQIKDNTENTMNYIKSVEESLGPDIQYELKSQVDKLFSLSELPMKTWPIR